jgi:hypothetical protein
VDDDRIKNGRYFGKDYFRELLERLRSIRASERRIYQQITDIFAECSIDYGRNSGMTRQFYAHMQDKFHFAITGHNRTVTISHIIPLQCRPNLDNQCILLHPHHKKSFDQLH